jgi:hypothetical protein
MDLKEKIAAGLMTACRTELIADMMFNICKTNRIEEKEEVGAYIDRMIALGKAKSKHPPYSFDALCEETMIAMSMFTFLANGLGQQIYAERMTKHGRSKTTAH